MRCSESDTLELLSIDRRAEGPGVDILQLETDAGIIRCRYHYGNRPVSEGAAAVIWVGGAGGGLTGPSGGMYPRLAEQLVLEGIDSLRLDYRHANHLTACVLDTLMGAAYLQKLGYQRLILVGHSFGGAVVITAGAQSPVVIGVVCLASQNAGTEMAGDLSPRALLLLHGEADQVLSDFCSRDIYARAKQPKQLILYPNCGHGFETCRIRADEDISAWIRRLVNLTEQSG